MQRRSFIALTSTGAAARASALYAGASPDLLHLGNSRLELTFDPASGALAQLRNTTAGRSLEIQPSAAAPVRIWLGTRGSPDRMAVAVARSNPQPFQSQVLRSAGDISLALTWKDMRHAGQATGLALTQTYMLSNGDDFVRVRTSIENRGPHWITGLFLGLEGLSLGADPKAERLVAGAVSGKPVVDPRHNLPEGRAFVPFPAGRRAFSVPPTVPNSLLTTWMDYSDASGGIGTGYLDRDMDIVGDVRSEGSTLALGWRLFRLEGTRGFLWGITGANQVYPLAPGEQFQSDEWLLVLHSGDWHRTATAYRKRYEKVFSGDFLDWSSTSPAVRSCDVVLNERAAWGNPSADPTRAYDYPHGRVIHRFDEIAPQTEQAVRALGVRPENVIVNVLGTAPDWGIYRMPDHFPMNEAAGGQAAAERMVRDLEKLGIAGVCCYAHPYFMHRQARNYVPEADTGWNYPHQDWHTSMGGIACLGSDEWIEMWTREIFPRYVAMGVRGLYMDEGFGHQFICTNPGHSHGGSALSLLTAQSRGATRLYKAFRSLAGPRGFLSCETASDVQARFIDLWHFNPSEVLRYTHPDRLSKANVDPKRPIRSVAEAFVFGCPILVMPFPEGGANALEGDLLQGLRQFVRLRRELREKQAPGYPHGFRDTDGLTISGGELRAKIFAGPAGATLAWFAEKAFQGEAVVDGRQLGVASLGRRSVRVASAANQMGYRILL